MKGKNLSQERAQRHFEIIYLLQDRKKMTAKELATYFEVSERTILRDIETLSLAEIPIYAESGKGGGIFIDKNYLLDKTLFTKDENETILTSLQCVSTAIDPKITKSILAKLSIIAGKEIDKVIEVDFTAWGGGIEQQFETIKKAIVSHKLIEYDYATVSGYEFRADGEPYTLVFKENAWYVKVYNCYTEEMQLHRLSRMRNIVITEDSFIPTPEEHKHHEDFQNAPKITITLKIHASQKYRIYDDFLDTDIIKQENDFFIVQVEKPDNEYTYREILSYGSFATVLEPQEVRENIKEIVQEMLHTYLS